MAKIASASSPLPEFKLPGLKLPKLDLDALFGLQKANLATLHEVQSVLVDAAQAIARVQYGWVEETVAGAQAALRRKEPRSPESFANESKAAAEKALSVAKQSLELAVAAQRRVVELVTQRGQGNANELKALAA